METPDEVEAVAAFERLGLTSYEAKTFIALQRLGTGTARDIARAADVPRSQVYGVAEDLEARGLLEVQQSTPIRYRAITVEEARTTLRERLAHEHERAFAYVESVRNEHEAEEEREEIWTISGRERVDTRVVELIDSAAERVTFGVRLTQFVTSAIEQELTACAEAGLVVHVVSASESVRERFETVENVAVSPPADVYADDHRSGRMLVVDDATLLLSVVDDDGEETAIWSADSLFASVLIQLMVAGGAVPRW